MIGSILARKAVIQAFDALNRHDLAKFMSAWHDNGVFTYPGDIPVSGVFEGRKAVEQWFRNFFDQFPKIRFELRAVCVKDIFAFTGTNVVSVQWDIYLTNRAGRDGQNSGVTVIEIAGGKVVRVRDFIFDLGDNFRRNWGAKA